MIKNLKKYVNKITVQVYLMKILNVSEDHLPRSCVATHKPVIGIDTLKIHINIHAHAVHA